MQHLSISRAWDETRSVLRSDGSLLLTVALALIGLPTAVMGAVSPAGYVDEPRSIGGALVGLIVSLVALVGQLALIRLALTRSETVGSAINHGLRRAPIFFLAVLLIVIALFIAAIPFGAVLSVAGVPLSTTADPHYDPATLAAVLLYMALILFVGVRFMLAAPVASAEPVGVFGVLRRSWQLTRGNWWRLFAFILMFVVATVVLLVAVGALVGVISKLLFGPPEPLSAGALVAALVQGLVNSAVTLVFVVMLSRIYAQLAGRNEAQASVPSSGM